MKKKLFLASVLLASSLHAKLSDEQILSIFTLPEGLSASIESRSELEGVPFEQIILLVKSANNENRQIFFSDGKYLFPDIIDTANKKSYANDFTSEEEAKQKAKDYKKLSAVLKDYPKDKILDLGDKNKELVYIFTDPLCPFCAEELKIIEQRLKEVRLKLVFTPIPSHGEDAVARSLAIQKEAKNAKSDEEKIKILRKYYNKENAAPSYDEKTIKAEQELIMKVFATGAVRGVPAVIEASSLGL